MNYNARQFSIHCITRLKQAVNGARAADETTIAFYGVTWGDNCDFSGERE